MASKPKNHEHSSTIGSALEEAMSELQELGEEMRSWYDNMSENLQGGEKAQTIESTADTLEGLQAPDVPEHLEEEAVSYTTQSKRKSTPRHMRCSNATSALGAIISACEDYVQKAEDAISALPDDAEDDTEIDLEEGDGVITVGELRERIESTNSFKDEIENLSSEADGVEFPGMMG
jgi:hypothetical protein